MRILLLILGSAALTACVSAAPVRDTRADPSNPEAPESAPLHVAWIDSEAPAAAEAHGHGVSPEPSAPDAGVVAAPHSHEHDHEAASTSDAGMTPASPPHEHVHGAGSTPPAPDAGAASTPQPHEHMHGPGPMPSTPDAGSGASPAQPGATDAGVTIYTCPMHPEVRQPSPGRCPKCGMKLVPEKPHAGGEQ